MIKNTKKCMLFCQFVICNEVILSLFILGFQLFSLLKKKNMKTTLSENYKYFKRYNLTIQFKPCHITLNH